MQFCYEKDVLIVCKVEYNKTRQALVFKVHTAIRQGGFQINSASDPYEIYVLEPMTRDNKKKVYAVYEQMKESVEKKQGKGWELLVQFASKYNLNLT